jgi:hypothetical protein
MALKLLSGSKTPPATHAQIAAFEFKAIKELRSLADEKRCTGGTE